MQRSHCYAGLLLALALLAGLAQAPQPAHAARTVWVANASQLTQALASAQPGDLIDLADGVYSGRFKATISGTASARITVRGSRNAILDGGSTGTGYGFHLTASYWTLQGFSIRNSMKGVMTDNASYNILDGLRVSQIGDEAVHFRTYSRHNVIQNSTISDTGLRSPGYGEGIYFGSAQSNWPTYTNGQPDTSDYNRAIGNVIGPNVRGESIDIKEGTTGGEVIGNQFDGAGMTNQHYDDSWVDVKGNGYVLRDNRGVNAPLDGFQTHVVLSGWGRDNVFSNNYADVRGAGYGFNIQRTSGSANGNVVYTNNTVLNASAGVANIALTSAPGGTPTATRTPTATPRPGTPTATRTPAPTLRPSSTPTPGGAAAWSANTAYAVGARVTYGGLTYRCLQAHTSLVGWEPPNVPALWQRV